MYHLPITKSLSFVREAVESLKEHLSICQQANMILVLTSMLLMQTLCLSTMSLAWLGKRSINALSHFFNYSGIDTQYLMTKAIAFGKKAMSLVDMHGRLVIDDTMQHHSRGCRCIDGVYWLFDHVIGAHCNAKCVVFAYFVVNEWIRFPIGWRIYRQNGQSKWRLAVELVDQTVSCGLKIDLVLFDSWYCVSGMQKELSKRHMKWISELKSTHVAEFESEMHPKGLRLCVDKVFEYCTNLYKEVWLGLKSSYEEKPSKVLYKAQETVLYLAAFRGKYKLIKSIDQRTGKFKIFVTNELTWEAQKVLEEYSYRWLIEEFFKNAKGLYGFEKAYIRSEQGGALTFFLVSFVDLLVSIRLWKSVQGGSKTGLITVSAVVASAVEENVRNLLSLTEDPVKFEEVMRGWLRIFESKKCQKRRERKKLVVVEEEPTPENSLNHDSLSLCPENMPAKALSA